MPEMPVPGEYHRQARFISGLDHFIITHRAARLNDGCRTRFGGGEQTIREGEESVRGNHRAFGERFRQTCSLRRFRCFPRGNARGIDAAHLPCAHTHRRAILGIDNRIRLHVFGDTEGEAHV